MADDDLSVLFRTFEGSEPRRETPEEGEPTWGDYGRALGVGALKVGSGFGALAEYATDGSFGGEIRRAFDDVADEQFKQTSPAFQKAANAKFLPDSVDDVSVWDVGLGRSIAAKATMAAPSMAVSIASAFPPALALRVLGVGAAARAAVAGGVAKGTAAAMNAGDVAGQIYENVEKLDHDTLMQSPAYAGYIEAGDSKEVAKKKFAQDAAGYAPILAGAITYVTGGLEGQLGKRIGGEAAKGIVKGGITGGIKELAQESAESGSGEFLTQDALVSQNIGKMDWLKILNATIEGGVVGAAMGGVGGAVGGIGKTNPGPLDPTTQYALKQQTDQEQPVPPPATPPAPQAGEAAVTSGVTPPGPPTTEGQEAPPEPNKPTVDPTSRKDYNSFFTTALQRLEKKGIVLAPDAADELSRRIGEMVTTIPYSRKSERGAAFRTILEDLYKANAPETPAAPAPTPAQATAAPATQQQADEAAMQAGIETLDGPVPERPASLQEQVKMLLNGQRQAVYLPFTTPEAERPKKPKGMERVYLKDGVVYYNPGALKAATIRKAAEANRLNDILPMGATPQFEAVKAVKERGADPKVVQVLKDGISVLDAASSSETVAQDAQQIAAQAPADAQVVVRNDPENVIQERIEGRAQDLAQGVTPAPAPRTGRVLEAVTNKENQKALNKQLAKNLQATKEKKAPRTFKDNEKKAKREADNAAAKELFAKWVPENPTFPQTDADRQALLDRLNGILNEANERGVEILDKAIGDTVSGELMYLTEARKLRNEMMTKKKKVSDDRILTFLSRELGIKKGEVDEVKSERRSEGEMANRQDQGDVETKADTSDAMLSPEEAVIAKEEVEESGVGERTEEEVVASARQRKTIFDEAREDARAANNERLRKIRALMDDPAATDGERIAAKNAIDKIEAGATDAAAEKLLADLVDMGKDRAGTFKKETRPKFDAGRPKVTGKISLAKKSASKEPETKPVRTSIELFRQNVSSIEDMRQNPDLKDVVEYAEWLSSLTDAQWKKLEGVFTNKYNPFLNAIQLDPVAARAELEKTLGEIAPATASEPFQPTARFVEERGNDYYEIGDYKNGGIRFWLGNRQFIFMWKGEQWSINKWDTRKGSYLLNQMDQTPMPKEFHALAADWINEKIPSREEFLKRLKVAEREMYENYTAPKREPLNVRPSRGRAAINETQLLAELESLVGQSNQEPLDVSSVEAQEEALKKGIILHNGQPLRALQNTTLSVMKRFLLKPEEIQNPVLREVTSFIWERIDARIPNMQVLVMLQSDIQKVSPDAGAFYTRIGSTDVIAVPAEELNDRNWMTAVLTHEAVHGMTSLALDNNSNFYDTIKAIADEVRSVIPAELMGQYGFTNAHEFLAEAFANRRFQEMLSKVQISDRLARQLGMQSWSVRSLWDGIVNAVRQLLNMPPNTFTALEGVMRVTKDVMAAQSRLPRNAELAGLGMVPSLTTRDAAKQAAQGFAEAVTPTSIGKRKALLATSTLDQIRQWYRGVFTNAKGEDVLEKLISNIQRIRPFADDKRERGEKLAQRFMDFAAKNREAANEFADIANSTTMLNAQLFGPNEHWGDNRRDSWQARALLPDLQRRFAEVERSFPGARELYQDMVAYYRDTQNEITRQLVDNILAEHNANLSDADRSSLTKKVMEGTLDEAAEKLVNNSTIFNALKDARALRLIDGDYFPLMRHGEFVVQTRDSVGDTMGGVEVEPGVIEFTGNKKADALKAAEAFAKRTTKGAGFTKEDGVPLVMSGPTAVEMPSDSSQFKYRVKVQLDGVHIFDTQAEAESFIRDQKGKFAQISEAPLPKRDDGTFTGELTNAALAAIAKSINARDNISQAQKEMMVTALKQAAVRQMAGNRVQKRALPRRGFVGASDDLARNTLVYAEASTRYLGKLRFMPLVREAFSEMQQLVNAAKYSKDEQMMGQVLEHLRKRVDGNVVTEQEASPLVRDIMTMSYIDKLFSPAYSFLQTLQPTMMTFPYLSGRYGVGDAGSALAQAYRAVGAAGAMAGGLTNTKQAVLQFAKTAIDATDVLGSILKNVAKQPDAKALTDLINELAERGAIDKNAGMEIAEVVTKGRGKWAMGLSKVDRIARQLPASIEQVNRAVTAIAAYRLAVQNGTSPEKAKSMAFDAVMNTQGDYSASNAPSVFNHPIWRISLQFKKYAQMYYAMFGDMLYRAFKDASPEERRVARKQLANVIAVQILAAGTLGIPGMEVIKIGFMGAAALGLGGGYDDFERDVREAAAAMFGNTAGELLTKGVIPRAIGIDLSTRLGADSLLTFGEPKKYDETNVGAYLLNTFAGAPGSLIFDQFKAARAFADGEFAKGAQLLPMPKFLADTAKATQKAIEGSTSSKTGRQTEEPIGIGTAALNAFGLRTADQAERSAAKGTQIEEANRRREATGEMSKLKNQFAEAKNEGERVRILARLKQLNSKLPEDQRQTPAQFKAFAKRYQQDKSKGLVSGGARFRNEAERAASERAGAVYNFTR